MGAPSRGWKCILFIANEHLSLLLLGRFQLLASFQLLPARIGGGKVYVQSREARHNGLKGSGVAAEQVWVCKLRMEHRLLGLQGFDALRGSVEFTLLQVGQALARPFGC